MSPLPLDSWITRGDEVTVIDTLALPVIGELLVFWVAVAVKTYGPPAASKLLEIDSFCVVVEEARLVAAVLDGPDV
ncbi:unnamed protein product [Blepharisma stoltei]|uniref:Uncharacterized protein n=1 Tax=Blepharisma stoltei TaxID=1481888 RepID=A0AAU9JAU9_9CILI|nr:unnamed protein product [Blepharisma stoltei]